MIEISSLQELEEALALSELFLFKHSTRCPISAAAHREVEGYEGQRPAGGAPVYRIKVIESRAVSDAVAQRLGVAHQSPQMILVRAGRAHWHVSHRAITAESIGAAIDLR